MSFCMSSPRRSAWEADSAQLRRVSNVRICWRCYSSHYGITGKTGGTREPKGLDNRCLHLFTFPLQGEPLKVTDRVDNFSLATSVLFPWTPLTGSLSMFVWVFGFGWLPSDQAPCVPVLVIIPLEDIGETMTAGQLALVLPVHVSNLYLWRILFHLNITDRIGLHTYSHAFFVEIHSKMTLTQLIVATPLLHSSNLHSYTRTSIITTL